VIPRGVQLVLLLVGLLALWVAARAARSVVEIVVVASFIALMLNPFVSFLRPPRDSARRWRSRSPTCC
jgi:predicted PurR-regulated permease PerM